MKLHKLELITELVKTNFKLRYNKSFLGIFWSFLKPLLMMAILYFVFTSFIKIEVEEYILSLLLGVLIWNYFVDTTKDSMGELNSKKSLITNTKTPLFIIILSACLSNFITLLINLFIFFLIFLIVGKIFYISSFLFILFLILLFIQTLGISLFIIPLYAKYRNFSHAWDVLVTMGFWVTPIVYTLDFISETWRKWIMLNPLARIIVDSRSSVIFGSFPEIEQIMITIFITLIVILIGMVYFNKRKKGLIEQI